MTTSRKILAPFLIILEITSLIIFLCIGIYFLVKYSKKTSLQKTNSDKGIIIEPSILPINAGQIVLIEGNQIMMLDTSTMQRSPLPIPNLKNPTSLTFSIDGNTLFTDSGENTLIIYNITTGNVITIPKMDPNPKVDSTGISPNNRYFILTQSCCPGDGGRVIVGIDGKLIKTLTGGSVVWSPEGSTVAISKGEYTLGLPLGPQPRNSSIYLEYVANNSVKEKLIIRGSNQISYLPIKWNDNQALLIKKIMYDEPIPSDMNINDSEVNDNLMKIYDSPKVSYLTFNIGTLKTSQATYEEKLVDNASYSSDHLWKIFTEGESVFVSKIDGSKKIKIGDNTYAVWRPLSQ